MIQAISSIEVAASADAVWELIGGFDSLPDWLPYIPKSETSKGGRIRHLANPDGEAIVEQLEKFDDGAHTYSYSILHAPFPVTGYLATIRIHPTQAPDSCHVHWSAVFTPDGVSEEEAARLFQGIFDQGLKALAARFATSCPVSW